MYTRALLLIVTLLLGIQDLRGQDPSWEKVLDVDGNILYVGFNRHTNNAVGFLSLFKQDYTGELWRTSDAGATWQKVPTTLRGWIRDMAFKDPLIGWAVASSGNDQGVYRTTDGGLTWSQTSVRDPGAALYYSSVTDQVYVSLWSNVRGKASADDGITWSNFAQANLNGFAFADNLNGIAATNSGNYIRTTDGGAQWTVLNWGLEAWQPLAIPSSQTYFAVCEDNGVIYRTDDHGSSWQLIASFPSTSKLVGDIKGNLCYLITPARSQTNSEHNGFMVSVDEGITWSGIGGPIQSDDVRFDLVGQTIFAGYYDNPETGLWKYTIPNDVRPTTNALVLNLQSSAGQSIVSVGDPISGSIGFEQLPDASNSVTELSFELCYDHRSASLINLVASGAWTIASQRPSDCGITIELSRTDQDPISETSLLTFELLTYLAPNSDRTLQVRNCETDLSQSGSSVCSSFSSFSNIVGYDVSYDECGDMTLHEAMQSSLPLQFLAMDPITGEGLELTLQAQSEGPITISLFNLEGKLVLTRSQLAQQGRNQFFVDVKDITTGTYFVVIIGFGTSVSRKLFL